LLEKFAKVVQICKKSTLNRHNRMTESITTKKVYRFKNLVLTHKALLRYKEIYETKNKRPFPNGKVTQKTIKVKIKKEK
jgi:hypothetical protein